MTDAASTLELVVFAGLQASGKSSFYRQRFAATHGLVSKDLFPSARHKTRRQTLEVQRWLSEGRHVVVDNTNVTVEERAALLELGHPFGVKSVLYYFESRLAECVARNAARSGKARIPDVGLYATVKKLEIPRRAEGFDELWYVRLASDGEFVVKPWEEP